MSEIAATTAAATPAAEKPQTAERTSPVRRGRMKDDAPPNIPAEALTFDDLLDFINPLHHLPIIGTLYREFTGDQIKPAMQVAGGSLFGGPTGVMSSIFQVLFEQVAGDDILGTGMTMAGLKEPKVHDTAAAAANPAAARTTAELPVSEPTAAASAAAPVPEVSRAPAATAKAAANAVVLTEAQDAYLRALAAQSGGAP
jgi:hypothetical protein